jgi:hypothetical protein
MSMLLTAAAVLGLAAQCQHSFPPEMILAIAQNESQVSPGQFDPSAVNVNKNGSRDIGLMQINSSNLSWLGLTEKAVMDPCISIAAAEAVLRQFSAYNSGKPNGSPEYAKAAYLAQRRAVSVSSPQPTEAPPEHEPARLNPLAGPSRTGRDLTFTVHLEK